MTAENAQKKTRNPGAWKKITTWSITALAVGAIATLIADANRWTWWASLPFNLAMLAGLVVTFIGAPKLFGGLKVGIVSLITGAALWAAGMIMKGIPDSSTILGVEFSPFGHPLYIIGWDLVYYGAILFIVGGIMAVVSYLRRVLRAVESRPADQIAAK